MQIRFRDLVDGFINQPDLFIEINSRDRIVSSQSELEEADSMICTYETHPSFAENVRAIYNIRMDLFKLFVELYLSNTSYKARENQEKLKKIFACLEIDVTKYLHNGIVNLDTSNHQHHYLLLKMLRKMGLICIYFSMLFHRRLKNVSEKTILDKIQTRQFPLMPKGFLSRLKRMYHYLGPRLFGKLTDTTIKEVCTIQLRIDPMTIDEQKLVSDFGPCINFINNDLISQHLSPTTTTDVHPSVISEPATVELDQVSAMDVTDDNEVIVITNDIDQTSSLSVEPTAVAQSPHLTYREVKATQPSREFQELKSAFLMELSYVNNGEYNLTIFVNRRQTGLMNKHHDELDDAKDRTTLRPYVEPVEQSRIITEEHEKRCKEYIDSLIEKLKNDSDVQRVIRNNHITLIEGDTVPPKPIHRQPPSERERNEKQKYNPKGEFGGRPIDSMNITGVRSDKYAGHRETIFATNHPHSQQLAEPAVLDTETIEPQQKKRRLDTITTRPKHLMPNSYLTIHTAKFEERRKTNPIAMPIYLKKRPGGR